MFFLNVKNTHFLLKIVNYGVRHPGPANHVFWYDYTRDGCDYELIQRQSNDFSLCDTNAGHACLGSCVAFGFL